MNDRRYEGYGRVREARRSFSRAGLGFTVFFLAATASQATAAIALLPFQEKIGEELYQTLLLLSMYPLALPLACLVIRTIPAKGPVKTCPIGGLRFLTIFVVCVGFMFVGNLIGQILMMIVGIMTGDPIANDIQEVLGNMDIGGVLLVPVLLAPLVEETLFRKMLIDRIAPYGQGLSILASGLLFGLAHGNFYQFFYAFALGSIFAYVYLHTGRIRYTIALHMMINFCGSVLPLTFIEYMEHNRIAGSMLVAGDFLLLVGCAILSVILLIVFRKKIFFEKMNCQLPGRLWFRTGFLNVGMILFLIYCLISFAFM